MKRFIFTLITLCIFSVGYSKNLWEKYIIRMEQFSPPSINEELFLQILKDRYNLKQNKSENSDEKEDVDIVKLLKFGLDDEEGIIRKTSLIYIVNHNLREFSRIIVEKIISIKNVTEKKLFIWVFGEIGHADDVLAIVEYLKDEKNPYILNLLAAAISKISEKNGSITPLLLLAKNSQNLYVKSTAIIGLGKIGDKRAYPLLWDFVLNHKSIVVRFVSILALSSVMKDIENKKNNINTLVSRFETSQSIYEKMAISFTVQMLTGYHEDFYRYLVSFLKKPVYKEVAIDFLENLLFRQGKTRIEIVMVNYPKGMIKERLNSLVLKLKRLNFR